MSTSGMHDLLDHELILRTVLASRPRQACDQSVHSAREHGAPVNSAVTVVELCSAGSS